LPSYAASYDKSMCGRFTMSAPGEVVAEVFGLPGIPALEPRFNIAPTQNVAVVREGAAAPRELAMLHWGLIPSWAKDRDIGNRMINARAETAAEKPAFRAAFRLRRCLAVADGFYEWARSDGRKRPYLVRFRNGRPFGLAGLWERWRSPEDETIESFTILTTTPNAVVAPLHDRMPVIIEPEAYALWLDTGVTDVERLVPLLGPFPPVEMAAVPVSLRVNNPANDDPACVEPAG
jgi:putative SOS response-associated peptidase YedK